MADLELGDALRDAPPEIEPEIKRDFISSLEAEPYDDVIGETCDKTDYVPLLDDDEAEPKNKLTDGGHAQSTVVANGEHGTGEIGVSDPFGSKLDEDVLADLLLPPDAAQIFPPLRDTEHLPDSMSEACLLDFSDSSGFFSPLQREALICPDPAQGAFEEGWLTDSYSKTGDTDTQSGDTSEKTTGTFGETPSDDSTNLPYPVTKSDPIADIWQPTAEEQLALSSHNAAEIGDLHPSQCEDLLFDTPVPDSQTPPESQLLPGLVDQLHESGPCKYEESDEAPEYLSVDTQNLEAERTAFLDQRIDPQEDEDYLSQEVTPQEESSSSIEDSPLSSECLVQENYPVENEQFGEDIKHEEVQPAFQASKEASPASPTQEEALVNTASLSEEESPVSSTDQVQEEFPADWIQESSSQSSASLASPITETEPFAAQEGDEPPIAPITPPAQVGEELPLICAAQIEVEHLASSLTEVDPPASPAAQTHLEPLSSPAAHIEVEPPASHTEVEPPVSPTAQTQLEPPASPSQIQVEPPASASHTEVEPPAAQTQLKHPVSPAQTEVEPAASAVHTELEPPASPVAQTEVEPPASAPHTELEPPASPAAQTQLESPAAQTQLEPPASPAAQTQLEPPASPAAQTQLEPPASPAAQTQLEPPASPAAQIEVEPPASPAAQTQLESPSLPPQSEVPVDSKPQVSAEETTLLSAQIPTEIPASPKALQQTEEVPAATEKDEPRQPEHPSETGKAATTEPAKAGSDITAPPNKELPASPEKKVKATTATPSKAAATPKGKPAAAPSPKKPLSATPTLGKKTKQPCTGSNCWLHPQAPSRERG